MFEAEWTQENQDSLPAEPGNISKQASLLWRNLSQEERDHWKKKALEAQEELKPQSQPQAQEERAGGQTPGDQEDGQTSADKGHLQDDKVLVINMGPYWVETRTEHQIGRGS